MQLDTSRLRPFRIAPGWGREGEVIFAERITDIDHVDDDGPLLTIGEDYRIKMTYDWYEKWEPRRGYYIHIGADGDCGACHPNWFEGSKPAYVEPELWSTQ